MLGDFEIFALLGNHRCVKYLGGNGLCNKNILYGLGSLVVQKGFIN